MDEFRIGDRLAGWDSGTEGMPLLMLHGAGCSSEDWLVLADRLSERHRVVALDLRGHGRSADLPWDPDAVLADIDDVVAARGIDRPLVVGHSLGGMLGLLWVRRRPDCLGLLNLDGLPLSPQVYYPGWTERSLRERLDAYAAARAEHLAAQPHPYTDLSAVYAWLDQLDLDDEYLNVRTRVHVVTSTRREQLSQVLGLPWLDDFVEVFRRGVHARLSTVSALNPHVTAESVPLGHNLMAEDPHWVTARILTFAAELAGVSS